MGALRVATGTSAPSSAGWAVGWGAAGRREAAGAEIREDDDDDNDAVGGRRWMPPASPLPPSFMAGAAIAAPFPAENRVRLWGSRRARARRRASLIP